MFRRTFAIAAVLALAVPTLAAADQHNKGGKPPPGKPGGAKAFVAPHGAPRGPGGHPGFAGPRGPGPRGPGPHGAQFSFHGRNFGRVHGAPFVYPAGWGYRRWAIGMALPALFLAPAYYYTDWAAMGLPPPEPGFQWVRYGPDLLLVNISTGQVVDVVYGAFY